MKFKKTAVAFAMMGMALSASAADAVEPQSDAEEHIISLDLDARLDWQYVSRKGHTDSSQTGFMGKYIALKAQGQLTDGLTYTWRQRFSRTPKDQTFWDQTDILELKYSFGRFDVSAGKEVVMIGGVEYNRPPIDLMCPNLFAIDTPCYQYGVSGGWQFTSNDHLALQITQSLFATSEDRNLYAYNLMWQGDHRLANWLNLKTTWSVNEIEYEKGTYCNYVALGNEFTIAERFSVIIDLMTRTYPKNNPFKNNTFMGEFSWTINPKWKVSAKASYDCNRGVNQTEHAVIARGTQLAMGGVVAEWFPISNRKHLMRLHAALFGSFGTNYNPSDLMQKDTMYGSVGLTWHMNLFNYK